MKMYRPNQRERVLTHLQSNKRLTSWEAFEKFRVTRLSAIIFNLRDDGYGIISHRVKGGDGARYVAYELQPEETLF
jgi:hypothetical protein